MKTVFNKNISRVIIVCIFFSLFTSCNSRRNPEGSASKDTLKGKITLSGAFALYPMVVKWSEEFQKIHPKVTINVSAGGAGKGMADALSKMVDLGMYSKEVSPEEQAKGAWWIGVARDAVLPTVNSQNPVLKEIKTKGMTRGKFIAIFIQGKDLTWGQVIGTNCQEKVQSFTRSDACGASDMWAKFLGGKKQEDLLGLGVNGDPGVAEAVKKNIGGIGYNNFNFVFDIKSGKPFGGIDIIPIDLNGNGKIDPEENFYGSAQEVLKAIREGKYPSPPARDLYLVSGGKPTNKLVLVFLQWILTEGQKFIPEAGYVELSKDKLAIGMEKIR